ncbi:sulfur carrier protein ThiS [Luteolibacter pohnpeiensis]|uniref:Sulfur carrier protein ThiS n=1 Tax=Luteolibacter pohnpeiensis TaxID=454153 RepID=A0A934SDG6_9BACT|nr:sulfur carrier protein ThiS [Luteolibacter pohnpeiensis]MBK1883218.1 sulfur carrier protein ThiS [Luteolibacter pohnpeiensis]
MNSETITLNGGPYQLDRPMNLADLLTQLGLEGKPVVVELDEEAVFPRDYSNREVSNGSRVEVVTLAAGG